METEEEIGDRVQNSKHSVILVSLDTLEHDRRMLKRKVDMQGLKEEVERLRRSRMIIIFLVYFALVMDNMLLTVVVPIIPDYLYRQEQQAPSILAAQVAPTPRTLPLPLSQEEELVEEHQRAPEDGKRARRWLENLSEMDPEKLSVVDSQNQALLGYENSPFLLPAKHSVTGSKYLSLLNSKNPSIVDAENLSRMDSENPTLLNTDLELSEDLPDAAFHLPFHKSRKHQKKEKVQNLTPHEKDSKRVSDPILTFDEEDPVPLKESSAKDTPGKEVPAKEAPAKETPAKDSPAKDTPSKEAPSKETPAKESSSEAKEHPFSNNTSPRASPHDIINENERVGILFSSKAFVQLLVNPLVGPLTARVGYSLPLVAGTTILILSALMFAYAESYALMFLARSLQGIASSCIAISGLGIVAECYPDDGERGRVQGLVMGGIALGVLAGYPAGGLLYDFTNSKTPPFLVVAGLTVVLAVVQLAVLNPRPVPERLVTPTPMRKLLRDPYILVTAGAIMVATSAMAVLEPCLPIWLTDTLHPETWQLGTAFIPDSIGYLLGTSCTGGPAFRLGRWKAAMMALALVALAAATVPEARSMLALSGPHLFLGLGVGTVDATLMPLLASLVDSRHVAAYGAVYAIAEAAVALAYGFGPLLGGAVVKRIGFPWLMRGVAIVNICYCPLLLLLTSFSHDPGEAQAILMAAPDPADYKGHSTLPVQPHESTLRYQKLFDEEED